MTKLILGYVFKNLHLKYFTPEILEKIDQAAITEYTYGKDEVYDDDGLGEDQG